MDVSDLRGSRVLYAKGALFVLLGVLTGGLLLWEHPTFNTALLLALAIWSFARAYCIAFYVIEHSIDDTYRFSGLWSFAQYALTRRDSGK